MVTPRSHPTSHFLMLRGLGRHYVQLFRKCRIKYISRRAPQADEKKKSVLSKTLAELILKISEVGGEENVSEREVKKKRKAFNVHLKPADISWTF